MLKLMIRGWKNKKLGVILIILGLIVEMIVFSIGFGVCADQYQALKDKYAGLPNQQSIISIDFGQAPEGEKSSIEQSFINDLSTLGDVWFSNAIQFSYHNGICTEKESDEIDLTESDDMSLEDFSGKKTIDDQQTVSILPIKMGAGGWKLPILTGDYWKGSQDKDRHSVILGKHIANQLDLNIGDNLTIKGITYRIIGISGRENRTLSTDDYIFVDFDDVFEDWKNDIFVGNRYSLIMKKGGSELNIQNVIAQKYAQNHLGYQVEQLSKQLDYSSFRNTVFIFGISSFMILIIVVINILNVIKLWLQERNKEFTVLLTIGATKKMLIRLVRCEIMIMAMISVVIACLIDLMLSFFFSRQFLYFDIVINLNITNILLSTLVALICANISVFGAMKTFNGWNPLKG